MSLEVFLKRGIFSLCLSSIYFHITKPQNKQTKTMNEMQSSWAGVLETAYGARWLVQYTARIPGSSLHPAWCGLLLLACFTVRSMKAEGPPRSYHWCCWDSSGGALAVWEAGMKAMQSSLLKVFWFRLLHCEGSVYFPPLIPGFVFPVNTDWKRHVKGFSAFVQSAG